MPDKSPKTVTIYGRLSFPAFTAKEAYDKSQGGQYPAKSIDEASPNFQLLVEDHQLKKLVEHIESVFLPYCIQQNAANEKRDNLDKSEVAALLKQIKGGDYDGALNTPFKSVHDKTAPLVPEAVATVKVIGSKGVDMELKARVNDESELLVNDGSQLVFPCIKPIHETVHNMYPGAQVAVTLNLYAYHNGKHAGFSAGGTVPVFKADADRLGGGQTVDEDEIFLD